MQEVDLCLITWWSCSVNLSGEVITSCLMERVQGRTGDPPPYDFTLKLHPPAQILTQLLSSHTFHSASVTVETLWNLEMLTWIPSVVTAPVVFLVNAYRCTSITLQAQAASFGVAAKVLQIMSCYCSDRSHFWIPLFYCLRIGYPWKVWLPNRGIL